MAKIPITNYAVEWNPVSNKGKIFVQIGPAAPTEVPLDNADEFIAIILMMSKPGVQFDNVTKEIEIPPRPTGT